SACLQMRVNALELRQADRGGDVGHAIIVAHDREPVSALRIDALATEQPQLVGKIVIIGGHHSTFTGGDNFIAEEAEGGTNPMSTNCSSLVFSADRFGRVFKDEQSALIGDLEDRVEINRVAVEMYRHYSLRAGRDLGDDLIGVHVEGVDIIVDKDRLGVA